MKVYIINEHSRVGKDTFVNLIKDIYNDKYPKEEYRLNSMKRIVPAINIDNISTIDPIKDIMRTYCNWNGQKEDKDRKLMCELKELLTNYCDLSYNYVINIYKQDLETKTKALFIHCREPEEIKKLLNTIPNSKTILVKRPDNDYCKNNAADLNVDNFKYNIIINNNSDLKHLKELAYNFCVEEKLIS